MAFSFDDFKFDAVFNPKQKSLILSEFNRALMETAKELLPQQVALFQQKIVMDLLRRFVVKTPVDTGRARGNWQVTISSTDSQVAIQGAPDKDDKANSPKAETAAADAVTKSIQVVNSIKPFSITYITNNVPYIVYLEDGTSTQAPVGMVSLSIHEQAGMFK